MNIKFSKYQGAGNDFILLDNRNQQYSNLSVETVAALCDRRFGIGADGLMLVQAHDNHDFEMVYHNADGKLGSMCGNGGRCIVAYAKDLGIIDKETQFMAVDGLHYAKISDSPAKYWVDLQMIEVDKVTKDQTAYVLNTGSPHYVQEVENLKDFSVYQKGYEIRNNETYRKEGINVNFVERVDNGLFARTFERGVEDETYACGTGATAVAMAMAKENNQIGHVQTPVKVLGGDLQINFDYDGQTFSNVFLCGPAKFVFKGEIEVEFPQV